MTDAHSRSPRRAAGMTLIEVLVAVLVLSIGLLGLAGLQTLSLRSNHSAYLRSQATVLAYDIVDRMRANRSNALDGAYNIGFTDPAPGNTDIPDRDLTTWKTAVAAVLPGGQGSVAIDAANATVTVIVRWRDSRDENADPVPFQMQTRL
jgi:type IV pilus assembly protein PilV